jgi:GTP-binding protein LepA
MLSGDDLILRYEAPLSEIIEDFLDNLKSVSQGYASFSYKMIDYRTVDLVKLDFAIVGDIKPSLSKLIERNKSYRVARDFLLRLKNNLPGQQFPQAIQAKIGGKIIAREDIRAIRKDVTAPLYGGDYTRKKKLLQKQQKGKKRLLEHASVRIPEEVYLKILKRD